MDEPALSLGAGVPRERWGSISERMAARSRDRFDAVIRRAGSIASRAAGVWHVIRFAASTIVVLILLVLALLVMRQLAGMLVTGMPTAHDLQALRDYLVVLVEIVVAFIVLALLVAILAWLCRGEPAVVSPFISATARDKLTAVSDLLVGHLNRIANVQRVCIMDIPGERLRTDPIRPHPETVDASLANVGSVNMGQATISIGQILITLKRLWPIGGRGTTISGSLQRYGKTVQLVATIQRHKSTNTTMVSRDLADDDSVIVAMVAELAYRIHHMLAGRRMEAGTWEILQCFTEARAAYLRYIHGGQAADLRQAVSLTWQAHSMDCMYGRLFGLFYGLGTCWFRAGDYRQAKELFHASLTIETGRQQALIQLSKVHYTLGEDADAMRLLQGAVEQPASHPMARYMLGLAYATVGKPALAVDELLKVRHRPRSLRSAAWVTIAAVCLRYSDACGYRSALDHVAESDFDSDAYSRTCWLSVRQDRVRAIDGVREALCKRLMPPEYMRRDPDLHFLRQYREFDELIGPACFPAGPAA